MKPRERFLAALRRERTDRPSLGTATSLANVEAMRLCGASFPEAHLDAKRLAELAAFVSLEIGFDMVYPAFNMVNEAAALGSDIDWGAVDHMPTIRAPLWTNPEEIMVPPDFEERPSLAALCGAISLLRAEQGAQYAVVGKVFGPWTLAYHMFGVDNVLMMTIDDPPKLEAILARLAGASLRSAMAQIRAGADALCWADHCSRDMCAPEVYRRFLFPLHVEIARQVPCPLILHTCGQTADRIADFSKTGFAGFHYDTRVPAKTAVEEAGGRIALMGGVNNTDALRSADEKLIRVNVRAAAEAGVNIIGPECAIPLNTPMRALRAIGAALRA
ncbi:MAG: MtaA/CmuA family methyltransferase [Verrucomicrobiae bacterium]|nr:MtaA/CmuA family methyltransferase [Verrucomicrobiae bacterium]